MFFQINALIFKIVIIMHWKKNSLKYRCYKTKINKSLYVIAFKIFYNIKIEHNPKWTYIYNLPNFIELSTLEYVE